MRTTLLALLVGVITAQAAMCAPVNLVKNAGFESATDAHGLPIGWWLWEPQKGLAKCAIDATMRHSGKKSLRMTLAKPGIATLIAPDIPVAPGETLDVSVWARAKDFVPKDASSTITANAAFRRSDGKFLRFVKFGRPIAEGKWQHFTAEATIPAGSSKLAVEVGLRNASGTVWFDDISVVARKQYAIRPETEIKEIKMGISTEISVGKSTWPIEIINRTGAKREVRLDAATGPSSTKTTIRLNGSPVQKAEVELEPSKPGGNTSIRVRMSALDTKELLAELNEDGIYVLNAVELEPLVPTHFCVEDGTPTVTARVWNNSAAGSFERLAIALVDASGHTLAEKTLYHPESGCHDVTLSSDKAVSGQEYSVVASLLRRNLSVCASQPWRIIHRSEAHVTINAQGFPVADGKPIFPLGTFNSGRYDLMAKTGFTVTHAWNRMYLGPKGTQTENQQAFNYLNQTQQAGMKALGFLHVAYMEREDWDGLRRRIRMFRNHPALLAWDSEEGVARGEVPLARLEKLSKIVREEDPNHPFVLADSYDLVDKVDRSKFFRNDLMDMGMWWYYPIPLRASSSSALLGREADDSLTLNPPSFMESTAKPLWVGMQAYVPDVPGGRLPTEAEFRCMAYVALVNDAKGLLYYMGGSANKMPGCTEERPWGYLQTLVPELHSLVPLLISPAAPENAVVTPAGRPVSTLLKASNDHYTMIVVNRGNAPCDLTISTPRLGSKPVEVLFENRTVKSESGVLSDHFEAYEVHVYRFAK